MGAAQKPASRREPQGRRAALAVPCNPHGASASAPGSDAVGPPATGLLRWKNACVYGDHHLHLTLTEDTVVPVCRCFPTQNDLVYPLSCPASLSITPVASSFSSSQETLSQDSTEPSVLRIQPPELALDLRTTAEPAS